MNRTLQIALIFLISLSGINVLSTVWRNEAKAQLSGRTFEKEILAEFVAHGIEIIPNRQWKEARLYREPDLKAVVLNAPYVSVFGHRARIEFLLLFQGRQILIETKRQRVSGSTDEKLPYVFANAIANIALEREFILVLDGSGWKPGAIDWIKQRARETEGFVVLRPLEFNTWLKLLSNKR